MQLPYRHATRLDSNAHEYQQALRVAAVYRVSSRDSGKTAVDAVLGEVMVTCEKIWWLVKHGQKWLKPEYRSAGIMVSILLPISLSCLYEYSYSIICLKSLGSGTVDSKQMSLVKQCHHCHAVNDHVCSSINCTCAC